MAIALLSTVLPIFWYLFKLCFFWHICTKILSVLEKYFEKINSHPYPLTYRDDTYFYKEYGLSDIMHFSEGRSQMEWIQNSE